MKLIVGLGNPGREYVGTRHNAGFYVLEKLAYGLGVDIAERKYNGLFVKVNICGVRAILLEPQTYMNNSGECVRAFMDYFKIDISDVIVIFDDISLEPGDIRIRAKGSAGGHNGIKSIIAHTKSQEFQRVKVGVGERPREMDLADHVLGKFSREDLARVDMAADDSIRAIELMINDNIEAAMNNFNAKKKL